MTSSPTITPSPTSTPKSAWQTTLETQDPQDTYFKVVDGQPVITVYDANQTATSIPLTIESIHVIPTADSLHPNFLTAKDAEGNIYLFNPDRGAWFTFFKGFAPTLEQFIQIDKSDIPIIIDYFRSQPPLVSPDAPPVVPGPRPRNAVGTFNLWVTDMGSCVGVASIKIQYAPGFEPYIVIWQAKMKNGAPGYLLGWIYDVFENNSLTRGGYYGDGTYAPMYTPSGALVFVTGGDKKWKDVLPNTFSLFNQPGYLEAIDKFISTGIIPPELENIILLETG